MEMKINKTLILLKYNSIQHYVLIFINYQGIRTLVFLKQLKLHCNLGKRKINDSSCPTNNQQLNFETTYMVGRMTEGFSNVKLDDVEQFIQAIVT